MSTGGVYITGFPVEDEELEAKYSMDTDVFTKKVSDGEIKLRGADEQFIIKIDSGGEAIEHQHIFESGKIGGKYTDNLSKIERDIVNYRNDCLFSRKIYNHMIPEGASFEENRDVAEVDGREIKKRSGNLIDTEVVFSAENNAGRVRQDYANRVIRAITERDLYRIRLAAHRQKSVDGRLRLESGNGNELIFSNIGSDDVSDDIKRTIKEIYAYATTPNRDERRSYYAAAAVLELISQEADTAAAQSLGEIHRQTKYDGLADVIPKELDRHNMEQVLDAPFTLFNIQESEVRIQGDGISDDDFKSLVDVIEDIRTQFMLGAGDLSELDEEGYRSVLKVALDPRIGGVLTRESETGRGPTDLRLQNEDDILYIGECKYWSKEAGSGAKNNVQKPLKQLKTYDQNQRFCSIIVFYNSEGFSSLNAQNVREKSRDRIEDYCHEATRVGSYDGEPALYEVEIEEGDREQLLSLHVIDVTAEQHHDGESS
jgi:hypothetical protein